MNIRCPYRRHKVEDQKNQDGSRSLRLKYRKAGRCAPKQPPGKASRNHMDIVIDIKGEAATGRFDDASSAVSAPCTLQNFRLSAFGLK
ncbi:MAG: hypothetical protein KF802_08275 [Bdellovibrionaceae bacterium]|nr:hypothetical protein [Pseudobdellovibrionaceae bacterium]